MIRGFDPDDTENFKIIQEHVGKDITVIPVLKDDGYGFGDIEAVKTLTDIAQEASESYVYTNFYRFNCIEEKIGEFLSPDDKCYILSDDDLYGHFVLRKQIFPTRTNSQTINTDTENICEAFLEEILFNNYDHVFVNKVSYEFNDSCKGLFQDRTISELSLYKINLQDGFELELEASF